MKVFLVHISENIQNQQLLSTCQLGFVNTTDMMNLY